MVVRVGVRCCPMIRLLKFSELSHANINRGRMAPSTPDPQSILRPTMRRKSSAQNLLSSFRPGTSSGTSSSSNANVNNTTTATTPSSNGINGTTHGPPSLLPAHILSAPLPPTPTPPPSSYVPPTGTSAPTSALPTPSTSGTSTPSHPQFSALHHHAQQQQQQQQQQSAFVALGGPASAAAVAATMREWDAQSMQADAQGPFMPLVAGGGSPGATVEYLRDLVQKRIITLTYMRNVHDGCVFLLSHVGVPF